MLEKKIITADFCVVGGGISGICAAIAAAREGIKVVLMHERAMLGGNASSEIRMWVCGAKGKNNRETGIIEEIMLENLRRNPTKNIYIWDTVLYEFVKREKNITLLLNCTCISAIHENGNYEYNRNTKIMSVTGYQMTTQTFIEVQASYYSDCSGDSILAPLVGAEFRIGREAADEFGEQTSVTEPDKMTMGMSCLIQGRQTHQSMKYIPPHWATKLSSEDIANRKPRMDRSSENFWYLELGGDRDCIADTEGIRDELVPLALGMWDHIKNSGDFDTDTWELEFLGFLPGKRESRRLMGEHIITESDISSGKKYNDTVAFGGWPLDDHYPAGFHHKGKANTNIQTPYPYCIPYRALYSINVENLFFAGRNISMTHMAMSSLRVMATCSLLGQAVGTAAAISVKNMLTPHQVYLEKLECLQDILLKNDCFLPDKLRKVSELCKTTAIKNGDDSLKNGEDRPNQIYNTEVCGITVENGTPLEYSFNSEQKVKSVHIVFDSDLLRVTLPGDNIERTHSTRANVFLDSPTNFSLPSTLCRNFILKATTRNGEIEILNIENNAKRCYDVEINKDILGLNLIISKNWGETPQTNVFSFDFTTESIS